MSENLETPRLVKTLSVGRLDRETREREGNSQERREKCH